MKKIRVKKNKAELERLRDEYAREFALKIGEYRSELDTKTDGRLHDQAMEKESFAVNYFRKTIANAYTSKAALVEGIQRMRGERLKELKVPGPLT